MSSPSLPLTYHDLKSRLDGLGLARDLSQPVAVGLSGGPDSMALAWLFSQLYANGLGPCVQALTVDHGLRPESAAEAMCVGAWVADWPGICHAILTRKKSAKATRIQEAARTDRYALMEKRCAKDKVTALFLAHHQDDQAETFLMRLAAGSGLDGLAGMQPVAFRSSGLCIARPFLDVSKSRLVATCQHYHIPFLVDPSNESDRFARVRLRQGAEILAKEGLTAERLGRTSRRLRMALEAVDFYVEKAWIDAISIENTGRIVFSYGMLSAQPADIRYRVLKKAILLIRGNQGQDYGPRMDRLEDIAASFFSVTPSRKATIGRCLITLRLKEDWLAVEREKAD